MRISGMQKPVTGLAPQVWSHRCYANRRTRVCCVMQKASRLYSCQPVSRKAIRLARVVGLYHSPTMPRFTDEDKRTIRDNYLKCSYREIGEMVGRSNKCISEYLRRVGLSGIKITKMRERKSFKKYRSYASWSSMISRCKNPNVESWPIYGGRGITVCERWKRFENFLSDMGEKPPGFSIDRIDPDGNYQPGNCRWIPNAEQSRTTRIYYAVGICCDCGTRRGNVSGRCHRCAEYFRRNRSPRPKTEGRAPMRSRPTKICSNCKRESRPTSHGRCASCAEYFRRKQVERPERLWYNNNPLKPSKAATTPSPLNQ